MIGSIYGVAEAAAMALLERLGVTSGGTYTPGGVASPESWVEVTTRAELQAGMADGAQILVTADITLGAGERIDLVAGTVKIARAAGVTITGGSTVAPFRATGSIAARLILVDTHEPSSAFLASHASVGPLFEVASGSTLLVESERLTLNIAAGGSFAGDGQRLTLDIGTCIASCPNGNAIFASEFGGITSLETSGGGAAASIQLNTNIERPIINGQVQNSGVGTGISVAPNNGRARVSVGPMSGTYAEASNTLCVVSSATLRGAPGCEIYPQGDGAEVLGGLASVLHAGSISAGNKAASIRGLDFTRLTEAGSAYRMDFVGCTWAPNGADTVTSFGAGCSWQGGEFYAGGGSINFQTSSKWSVYGAVGGLAITIDSGAQMRVTASELAGITNNDPLTIITGSRGDASVKDTTPATRGFADSSGAQSGTLNTELLPYIVGYWDCVTLPAPNRGPGLPSCSAGPILDMSTARTVTASSAGLDSGAGTAVWRASMPIYTGAGDFTFSCYHNPDDATPASETHILTAGTTNGLDLLASGALRIYLNGGVILDSSTGVLSDGVESRITYLRRNNAGTPTIYIYVDGVEVGSVANSTVVNPSDYFGNTNGTSANPGVTRRAIVANCGISEATENLLDTYWLQGAGNA